MRNGLLSALLAFSLTVCSCSIDINPSQAGTPHANAKVPAKVPWRNLNLSGKLVYNLGSIEAERISTSIQSLDLVTGKVSTIFEAEKGGWVDTVAVSPDAKLLIMSYGPPTAPAGQTALYSMPLDSSQPPQLLFTPPTVDDEYTQPYGSPDGKTIYFAHINYRVSFNYDIMRMGYPSGAPDRLIENAYWPRPSDDGTRLVYTAMDPESGINSLFISNSDGTNAQAVPVMDLPVPEIIDAPMFSADNQTILFSSPVGLPGSAPNLLERVMGVSVALADGTIPSDWWTVTVTGGKATQITRIRTLALYGSFSPDKKYIASYSSDGIFVMKPDGTEITMIVRDVGGISGTVCWIP